MGMKWKGNGIVKLVVAFSMQRGPDARPRHGQHKDDMEMLDAAAKMEDPDQDHDESRPMRQRGRRVINPNEIQGLVPMPPPNGIISNTREERWPLRTTERISPPHLGITRWGEMTFGNGKIPYEDSSYAFAR